MIYRTFLYDILYIFIKFIKIYQNLSKRRDLNQNQSRITE